MADAALAVNAGLHRVTMPPFYVYNSIDWPAMRCGNVSIDELVQRDAHFKHSADYWMLQHALRHASRTHAPQNASLFFAVCFVFFFSSPLR